MSLTPVIKLPVFWPGELWDGTTPALKGSVTAEKMMGTAVATRAAAWVLGVAMVWIRTTLARTKARAAASALAGSPCASWRRISRLTPSLKPEWAKAASKPFSSASSAGWETNLITPTRTDFVTCASATLGDKPDITVNRLMKAARKDRKRNRMVGWLCCTPLGQLQRLTRLSLNQPSTLVAPANRWPLKSVSRASALSRMT